MLTDCPAVSRPSEARRKVLTSSSSSSNTASSLLPSKPIRAKVDLAAVTSPPSPSWSPGQPVRARVQLGGSGAQVGRSGGHSSAPSTPLSSSTPFPRAHVTPTASVTGGVRATLSPTLASSSSSTRAPSPVRARSPDAAVARTTPTARTGARVVGTPKYTAPEPPLLRGQSDPFPSTPSTVGTATPISHLPSSVSVRRLHSPSLRQSPSVNGSLAVHASSEPSLPPLSSSPSASPSPLHSPTFKPPPLNDGSQYLVKPSDSSFGRRAGAGIRRTSGVSAVSSVSDASASSGSLLPPINFPSDSHPVRAPLSVSPPLLSPPLQPIPVHAGPVRSPTLSSFPSSRNIKAPTPNPPPSRPPLTSTNTANRRRHARSNSVTSTSSRSSAFSGPDEHHEPSAGSSAASWSRARTTPAPRSRPASPTTHLPLPAPVQSNNRAPLSAVDWSSFSAIEDAEVEQGMPRTASSNGGGRTSSGSEVSGVSVGAAPGSPLKEVDEKEREARVERKILDLEITNQSLLSINASLERLKLKHTSEIRELKRRLRESVGGAGLAALRKQAAALDEGESSDPDDEGDDGGGGGGEGEDDEPEQTWQELLDGDEHFSAVAATLESLVRRAKTALEYVPAVQGGGRVLSTVEQEDRLDGESGEEEGEGDGEEEEGEGEGEETEAPSAGRSAQGLGIAGWQRGR
ncbi:hypothetical protein JCM8097_009500 [Rhodosporidiobolus ruineniae]